MFAWKKSLTREISFFHSMIIILGLFLISTIIIYHTTMSSQAMVGSYSQLTKSQNNLINNNIIVTSPKRNELVGANFILAGSAKLTVAKFYYRVKDSLDAVLLQGNTLLNQAGEPAPFFVEINLNQEKLTLFGKIEIYLLNSHNGLEENLTSVPVRFVSPQ